MDALLPTLLFSMTSQCCNLWHHNGTHWGALSSSQNAAMLVLSGSNNPHDINGMKLGFFKWTKLLYPPTKTAPLVVQLRNTSLGWFIFKYHNAIRSCYNIIFQIWYEVWKVICLTCYLKGFIFKMLLRIFIMKISALRGQLVFGSLHWKLSGAYVIYSLLVNCKCF